MTGASSRAVVQYPIDQWIVSTMGKRGIGLQRQVVLEAARIICEQQLTDYRLAKLKAAERLGIDPRKGGMPDNASIQEAVIEYQRLFGGRDYAQRLQLLRETAVRAMELLCDFDARLVGAVASGATTDAHLVRLHGFADKPEMLDMFLENRGIPYQTGERRYRYADGRTQEVPTARFEAGEVGIEVAMFAEHDRRRAPLSPHDGQPMKRLTLVQAKALATSPVDVASP